MSHGNKDNAISQLRTRGFLKPRRHVMMRVALLRTHWVARSLNYCATRLEHERKINETGAIVDLAILMCNRKHVFLILLGVYILRGDYFLKSYPVLSQRKINWLFFKELSRTELTKNKTCLILIKEDQIIINWKL